MFLQESNLSQGGIELNPGFLPVGRGYRGKQEAESEGSITINKHIAVMWKLQLYTGMSLFPEALGKR